MIDIEKLKQAALISNGEPMLISASEVLELITRLEDLEVVNLSILTDLGNLEEKLVAQELVIQQMQEHIQTVCAKVMEAHAGPTRLADFKHVFNLKPSTEHLEARYKSMVGEPVAWNYKLTEEAFVRLSVAGISMDTPLHVIKPFPFKEK